MKTSGQLPVLIFGLCLFIISVCGLPIKGEGNPENRPHPGDIGEKSNHICIEVGKKPQGDEDDVGMLGKACLCTITNGTRYCTSRMMYDSTSDHLVCSQCCKDHYWDRNLKKCKECAPSGMREDSNVAKDCLPRPEWKSENSTQETPPSTTTSKKVMGKNNENSTAESIRVSIKTPMKTEETIKQYNSTTGSAGESVELLREITAKGENSISESIPSWPWYYWFLIIIGAAAAVAVAVLGVLAILFICRRKERRKNERRKKRVQQSRTARFSRGESGENRPSSNAEVHSIPEADELLEDEDGTVEITCEPGNAA